QRGLYGESFAVKENIQMKDLLFRVNHVIRNEIDVAQHQLERNNVELISAEASFVDAHKIRLDYVDGSGTGEISTEYIVIATGSSATRSDKIPFDGKQIFTSDDILTMDRIPRKLSVVGAGVIGIEYASIFAALGVRVTVIEKRERLLPFVDQEIVDSLIYHLRSLRVTFRLGEEVIRIEHLGDENEKRCHIHLASGKQIVSNKALYSIGRTGASRTLNLSNVGLQEDARGRIKVNENYQTEVPNIYAVGDVIGFPSLASTSMEQGRLAAAHAFEGESNSFPEIFPYGIYSIPEISMVGKNELELTEDEIPYSVGKASYRELARGQIIGDSTGLLKVIFHLESRKLLGVHIIGQGASELIHIGQAVLSYGGDIDYFIKSVFNYPTLAEAYKTAAFDGINRLS
ncbi:MAG: Si-specific NAD(P)(+) transhydrogenase, partial [Chloroflexi bacterium]|nr:Si-specific NAD(P)(+) transhydrogenase [Chloroflexota bacterium]